MTRPNALTDELAPESKAELAQEFNRLRKLFKRNPFVMHRPIWTLPEPWELGAR